MGHETRHHRTAAPVENGCVSEASEDLSHEASPNRKARPVEKGSSCEASDDMDQASPDLS